MDLTVIVPTFRRPENLRRCLDGLKKQTVAAHEVLLVVREDDEETAAMLAGYDASGLPLRCVGVRVGGVVAALNEALASADADVLAFTDDDAIPRPTWIEHLARRFRDDPHVGGVGGPDWIHSGEAVFDGSVGVCGSVQWFGRIDHSATRGSAVCDVDILKGCNMAFRHVALEGIRFDERLAGDGAQMFNEFGVSLAVRRAGWRLVYDREVVVDHYPGRRFDKDARDTFVPDAHAEAVHNLTLLLLTHLQMHGRIAYLGYALLLGSRSAPGLAWLPLLLHERAGNDLRYWKATARGHQRGIATFLRPQRRPVRLVEPQSA